MMDIQNRMGRLCGLFFGAVHFDGTAKAPGLSFVVSRMVGFFNFWWLPPRVATHKISKNVFFVKHSKSRIGTFCSAAHFRIIFFILPLLLTVFPLHSGESDQLSEKKRNYFVHVHSLPSDPDVFLLSCTVVEQASSLHSSFSNTIRLPVLPLRIGKWEESRYVLPGKNPDSRKIQLQEGVEFCFPELGISRKALLKKSKAGLLLTLFWFEGTILDGKYRSLQIFTTVELSGSTSVCIWPPEETQK